MNTPPTQNGNQPTNFVGKAAKKRRHPHGKRRPRRYRLPCPAEFWTAFVPFTDGEGGKNRPVLVLSTEPLDVIVAPLTGDPPEDEFDIGIRYWQAAGMNGPGTVRCARICALDRRNVFEMLGRILPDDLRRVLAGAKDWFAKVVASATALDEGSLLIEEQLRRMVGCPFPDGGDSRVLAQGRLAA